MRTLLVLLIGLLLSMEVWACGGVGRTGSTSGSSSSVAASNTQTATVSSSESSHQDYTKVDGDKDNDITAPYDDKSNSSALDYGRAASAQDRQAVAESIKRYYAAAVAGDGAKACSMIVSSLAESVAEDYGRESAGPSYLSSGTTCPAVMVLLFKHSHRELAAATPHLRVTRVRLVGRRGYAILSFGALEREIPVIHEGRSWKVQALLDSELP